MNIIKKEYQVLIINPKRCIDCETCMGICSLVHESDYIHLTKRIIGSRTRIELEWAIDCDLCYGMKDNYASPGVEKKPQCVDACPQNAIFVGIIESYEDDSREEAIKRIFL